MARDTARAPVTIIGVGDRGQILKSKAPRYLALPYGQQWRRLTLLLADMERAKVEHAMVSGMPFLKKWSASEPFARPSAVSN